MSKNAIKLTELSTDISIKSYWKEAKNKFLKVIRISAHPQFP